MHVLQPVCFGSPSSVGVSKAASFHIEKYNTDPVPIIKNAIFISKIQNILYFRGWRATLTMRILHFTNLLVISSLPDEL